VTGSVNSLTHEEAAELLGAYALDALDPDEAALVEEHLDQCPRCRAEVARHHEVAGLLANSGAEAPAEVWDRIAGRLETPDRSDRADLPDGAREPEEPERPEWERLAARLDRPPGTPDVLAGERPPSPSAPSDVPAPVVPLDQRRRRHRRVTAGITLVASAAAVLALVLGVQVAHLNHQVGQLQSAAARPGLSSSVQAALEAPSTTRINLVPPGPQEHDGTSVTVALTSSGAAYLIPKDLATLPPGRTYQLWGRIDGRMISLGLLGSRPAVTAFSVNPNAPVSLFAVTAEPSGGVLQPTTTPVVQGVVTA
jgi:anti-sigma factor RsiW